MDLCLVVLIVRQTKLQFDGLLSWLRMGFLRTWSHDACACGCGHPHRHPPPQIAGVRDLLGAAPLPCGHRPAQPRLLRQLCMDVRWALLTRLQSHLVCDRNTLLPGSRILQPRM